MKPAKWFGTIILYTFLTIVCSYFIPSESVLSVFRFFFGLTFVAILPGYCLINFLFQEGKLDWAEQTVLSVALSFSIAAVSGLFIGLSPIRITVPSIVNSLCGIVLFLATLAFLRKINIINLEKLNFRKAKPITTAVTHR